MPWEMLYADDLAVISEIEEELIKKLNEWKDNVESKCMRVNMYKTKVMISGGAFSALTLSVGQQEGHPACKKSEWWGSGVVICLKRGADLHIAQLMPLPLTVSCCRASVKSRLVFTSRC